MPKKSKYNDLYLDTTKLKPWIEEYCSNALNNYRISGPNTINALNNQKRFIIKYDLETIELDYYEKKDRTTTIRPIGGGERLERSTEIADFILTKLEVKEVDRKKYIMSLKEDDFNLLVEYLRGIKGVNLIKEGTNDVNSSYYKQFQSDIGDKITLTYYKTKERFQFDGTVLNLYQEINFFLSAIKSSSELIRKEEEVFKIIVDYDQIDVELKSFMPNSYCIIDRQLITLFTTSIVFKKIVIDLPDYSSFVFPALRGLEGYIKQIFGNNRIMIDHKRGFCDEHKNYYFRYDKSTGQYKFNHSSITCNKTKQALEECYDYFHKQRHSLFHTDTPVATTRIINKRQDADNIVNYVLNLVERTYGYIV